MKRARIYEEQFDFYQLDAPDAKGAESWGPIVEVPPELLERYRAALVEMEAVNDELRRRYGALLDDWRENQNRSWKGRRAIIEQDFTTEEDRLR